MAEPKKRNVRDIIWAIDVLYVVLGAIIVIMAIMAFISPEDHMLFFPAIFLLAGILNLINGIQITSLAGRDKKKRAGGTGYIAFGAVLIIICIISAISVL